ncbi:MAG TPA: phospho-N-acetylmuramoyl-pentapeptide-transferase [Caulobacteraceae bacterium]|jgi:phospho-N-acetylmuramoyl-pentapeptide-transferase
MFNYLYLLAAEHGWHVPLLGLMKYITFRTGLAIFTAQIVCVAMGSRFIRWIQARQGRGQPIREDGPETHIIAKAGTPTMGGFMILAGLTVATLLWGDLTNPYVWTVLGVTAGYGVLGFIDDYRKVTRQTSTGVRGSMKLLIQFAIAGSACLVLIMTARHDPLTPPGYEFSVALPMAKAFLLNVGWFYLVFTAVVIVGASNAVNITDGLDGLAIVPVMIAAAAFGVISYMVGNALFANYLQIHFVKGVGELAVMAGAIIGAGLGFLWYNAPPAKIFMGDTGSLALGGGLGTMAVATKHEIVLAIVGGLFVLEAVSVMLQIAYFKATGRRIFLMAPIHHHFEKLGWAESTVVIRFWIVAVVLALIGLGTLKLR